MSTAFELKGGSLSRLKQVELVGRRAFLPTLSLEPDPLPSTPKNDLTTPIAAGVPCSSVVSANGDDDDDEEEDEALENEGEGDDDPLELRFRADRSREPKPLPELPLLTLEEVWV